PPAALEHVWQRRPAAVPAAAQADGETAPPVLVAEMQRIVEDRDAGVVDEHVGWPEVIHGRRHHSVDRPLIADVGLNGDRLVSVRPERLGHGLSSLRIELRDDDPGALLAEAPSGG